MSKKSIEPKKSSSVRLYVGTYTEIIRFGTGELLHGKGEGIYQYILDTTTGCIDFEDVNRDIVNPSYIALSPSREFMYAVNELKEFEGAATGTVSAFARDPDSGKLTLLNTLPTQGTDPCHISTDATGSLVFVANFMSGSVAVYRVLADGSLYGPTDFVQHRGHSIDPDRQKGPHAHSVTYDSDKKLLCVPDLGLDKTVVYAVDPKSGILSEREDLSFSVTPGDGPRHIEFHPNRKYAYLVNELSSRVTAFSVSGSDYRFEQIQNESLLPVDYSGQSTSADIHITPSGGYLFCSNRGHDSIAGFRIDQASCKLSFLGHTPTGGRTPRNFVIDPTGSLLIVANQDSDSLVSFWIEESTGNLVPTGCTVEVPTPVCIKVDEMR